MSDAAQAKTITIVEMVIMQTANVAIQRRRLHRLECVVGKTGSFNVVFQKRERFFGQLERLRAATFNKISHAANRPRFDRSVDKYKSVIITSVVMPIGTNKMTIPKNSIPVFAEVFSPP